MKNYRKSVFNRTGGCPRTVEPYTSANAVISTSIKADAGVAYSCTFILAVPAPYTRIRLSCPVMIAVVRTTDGNGVTNIEMQPLTGVKQHVLYAIIKTISL